MLGYLLAVVAGVAAVALAILLIVSRRQAREFRHTTRTAEQRATSFEQRSAHFEQQTGDLEQQLARYQGIADIERALTETRRQIANERHQAETVMAEYHARWTAEQQQAEAQLGQTRAQAAQLRLQVTQLSAELAHLNAQALFEAHGLYESRYDFGSAQQYKQRLEQIRQQQKTMVKDGIAAVCRTTWMVEGDAAKGRKMINNKIKLMLRAFNGECDSAVYRVKYNNVESLDARIRRSFDAVNKLASVNQCEITRAYLDLKLDELALTYEYQEKLQAEREEQRLIREQMRDEERAAKEIEAAKKDALVEEQKLERAIAKAREQAEQAAGKRHDQLMSKIEALQSQLSEAASTRERAVARAQLTRSGHVYVISNVGSFGENVYKIGMTRRLEPLDRVKELGDASVPFRFDVHAMIYAEDAPKLEKALHHHFADRQVNLVNSRKEFFAVHLDEVEAAVKHIHGHISFVKTAAAEEYRKSEVLRTKQPGRSMQAI